MVSALARLRGRARGSGPPGPAGCRFSRGSHPSAPHLPNPDREAGHHSSRTQHVDGQFRASDPEPGRCSQGAPPLKRWLSLAILLPLLSCDAAPTGPEDRRIGPEGGSAVLEDGAVQITVPAGALDNAIWFTAFPALNVPASPLLVSGTTWELGPLATTFARPVTVTVAYDPGTLPENVGEEALGLYRATGDRWQLLEYASVDQDANTVSGGARSLGRFGIKGMELKGMEVTPRSATLSLGGTLPLSATPIGEDGRVLSSRPVTWSSSDSVTAAVDSEGVVTGRAEGTAVITASSGDYEDSTTIQVRIPVKGVEITPSDGSMTVGGSLQLQAVPRSASGEALAGRSVTWSSGNTQVATVDSSGLVTGRSLGSVIVTATVEGVSAMITVTVHGGLVVTTESLAPAQEGVPYTQTLAASGGDGSYQWSLATGELPSGLTLTAGTGVIGGTPSTAGVDTISVRVASAGQTAARTLTIQVVPAAVASVAISPPSAELAVADTLTLSAVARDASGAALADRETVWASSDEAVAQVSSEGLVTALHEGTVTISATVDGFPAWATVNVRNALTITDSTLSPGIVSHPYSDSLAAAGGDGVYTWALLEGLLPPGLFLSDSTGVIWGTPTAADSARLEVAVASGDGQADTLQVDLVIRGVLQITTTALKTATEGVAYADTLRAAGGKTPYRWSVTAGSLPAGMALDAGTGVIAGTPTASGTPYFVAEVESDDLQTDTLTLPLEVNPTPVAYISLSPTSAALIQGDTLQMEATPRDADGYALQGRTVTWSTGASGVATVNGTGLVTAQGVGTTTITAASQGISASAAITVHAILQVTTATLAQGSTGAAYEQTLAATGGDGVFTWAVSSGALPAGLSLEGSTGRITGVPVAAGTTDFTVQVTSGDGQSATRALSVTIL